jgi:hypothetical protein
LFKHLVKLFAFRVENTLATLLSELLIHDSLRFFLLFCFLLSSGLCQLLLLSVLLIFHSSLIFQFYLISFELHLKSLLSLFFHQPLFFQLFLFSFVFLLKSFFFLLFLSQINGLLFLLILIFGLDYLGLIRLNVIFIEQFIFLVLCLFVVEMHVHLLN